MRFLKWAMYAVALLVTTANAAADAAASTVANAEETTAFDITIQVCASCHGQDGASGIAPDYPNLAGQNARYLLTQMQMIQSGARPVPLMAGQLDGKSEEELRSLAEHYANMPVKVGRSKAESLDAGMRIYRGGIMDKGVAACSACHSPTGIGNAPAGFPVLSGQRFDYVVAQLVAYREGARTTDADYGGMMRGVASRLTDTEIRAVANYIQGLY